MVCSFLMLVFDKIELHMVFAYFKMEQVVALNVETINSFCLPFCGSKCLQNVKRLFCFSDGDIYVSRKCRFVVFGCDRVSLIQLDLVQKVSGSFVCVYMKIISGAPFIYFVKIWLNKLLSLTVFGVRCSDCYVISSFADFLSLC